VPAASSDPEDIRIKRLLDEICMIDPCLGSRKQVTLLKRDHGVDINRKRVQRLRREIGHEAIWCKPRTSIPDHGHRKYPYLLRDLTVSDPTTSGATQTSMFDVGCSMFDVHPPSSLTPPQSDRTA
jgi:putative transposase